MASSVFLRSSPWESHCRARDAGELAIVYAVVDDARSPDLQLGDAVEIFLRREDAERFSEGVRGDDPEVAEKLRIERVRLEFESG